MSAVIADGGIGLREVDLPSYAARPGSTQQWRDFNRRRGLAAEAHNRTRHRLSTVFCFSQSISSRQFTAVHPI